MTYDLIIIGGGPAGAAGAVYAARKRLKTLLITSEFGGQSVVSDNIENWLGTKDISGADLAKNLKEHAYKFKGDSLDIQEGMFVNGITKNADFNFTVSTMTGEKYDSRGVLVVTGSGRRKLEAENADTFENKGVTYCASCDGPIFADMDVAVIGGGNAAFETAAQLLAYCKSVILLHRSADFKADAVTVEKVLANPKMTALRNVTINRVEGEKFVNGITFTVDGEKKTIPVSGIFVEIGQIPNTDFLSPLITLDTNKKVPVDPMTQKTSVPGIWAAGDCTNGLYHQNNIAAGDAVKALEDIYITLHKQG